MGGEPQRKCHRTEPNRTEPASKQAGRQASKKQARSKLRWCNNDDATTANCNDGFQLTVSE